MLVVVEYMKNYPIKIWYLRATIAICHCLCANNPMVVSGDANSEENNTQVLTRLTLSNNRCIYLR